MNCVICKHGNTEPGVTTLTLSRDAFTCVIRKVPARVCATCGEACVDEPIVAQVSDAAEAASQAGAQFMVRDYVAM